MISHVYGVKLGVIHFAQLNTIATDDYCKTFQ